MTGPRYHFTGEEFLLGCLSKITTGDPWTRLIDVFFSGDPRRLSYAFRWLTNHLCVLFYHNISSRSMEIWLRVINNFKQMIVDRLWQPAHPREMDFYHDMGARIPADQYIIDVESVDDWRVKGFIDDTAVRSCRPGSGPVGPEVGHGRPHRQHAYLIKRAFYR